MNSHSEASIVEQAKTDIQYFKYLYDDYYPKIFAYVMFLTEDRNITEDVVSQTFEKAIYNIKNYTNRGYSFGAWLYAISRNLVYDFSKEKNTYSLDMLEEIFEYKSNENLEQTVSNQVDTEALYSAINKLPPSQREVILLRYIQEFSIEETSIIIGKTQDAVKSLAKRAIGELESLLKGKISDTF